jgi:hypothetical protein
MQAQRVLSTFGRFLVGKRVVLDIEHYRSFENTSRNSETPSCTYAHFFYGIFLMTGFKSRRFVEPVLDLITQRQKLQHQKIDHLLVMITTTRVIAVMSK